MSAPQGPDSAWTSWSGLSKMFTVGLSGWWSGGFPPPVVYPHNSKSFGGTQPRVSRNRPRGWHHPPEISRTTRPKAGRPPSRYASPNTSAASSPPFTYTGGPPPDTPPPPPRPRPPRPPLPPPRASPPFPVGGAARRDDLPGGGLPNPRGERGLVRHRGLGAALGDAHPPHTPHLPADADADLLALPRPHHVIRVTTVIRGQTAAGGGPGGRDGLTENRRY